VAQHSDKDFPDYRYFTKQDDTRILENRMRRVTDTSIPEDEAFRAVEQLIVPMWKNATANGTRRFWHEYFYELVQALPADLHQGPADESWLLAAAEAKLPLVVPGYEDSTFGNIGANFPNGLPMQPWAKALMAERKRLGSKDNPDAHCLPMGIMQFHEHPQPRKMIQTPDVLVILYEGNAGVRQIFTDGRPLPTNDPQPWWYGYSVGRWEGDTLVVETNNLRGAEDGPHDGWLDVNGSPYTQQARFTERIRRPAYGHLQIDFTVDDPKSYTKPWTVRVDQRILPGHELIEAICNENQQFRQRIKID
jgi:hypothetical protein